MFARVGDDLMNKMYHIKLAVSVAFLGILLTGMVMLFPACTIREPLANAGQDATLIEPSEDAATVTGLPKIATPSPPTAASLTPHEMATITTEPEPDEAQTAVQPVFLIQPFDRSPYVDGLVEDSREMLQEMPGAPVYHIAINVGKTLTQVSGRQTVYFTNRGNAGLDEVYFHLHPNQLDGSIAVTEVFVEGNPVTAAMMENDTALRVPLGKTLQPGQHTVIDMAFETTVPVEIGRNYGVLAYYRDILALAHFYPMLSVRDATGWNTTPADLQGDLTYSDAAFYLVEVTAPRNLTLVATGNEIARSESGDRQTVRFAAGPARDFFLAASEDYTAISSTIGETTINSYAPSDLQDGAEYALHVAAAAMETFSQWLGTYPYTELDIVTTPTSALGIEYPGILVGTVNMYNLAASTTDFPVAAILESTTAHEVAHQWFYNVVGNDQLDEPWLDEALATYLTYRYFLDQHGEGGGEGYFSTLEGRWDRANREAIPIGQPVAAYIGSEYGSIVYGRGAVFIRELEETLGRETFDAFLRDYVAQFSWDIATATAFRELAETHCDCDLGPLWAEWVD
jgi:hypothetical protein